MNLKKLIAGVVAASVVMSTATQACTSVAIKTDGGMVYGRSMEEGLPLNSQMTLIPRGVVMQGVGPTGKEDGLQWTVRYRTAGLNVVGTPILADGMNEAGLVGGIQNAPNTAQYQTVPPGQNGTSIASAQILTYALTQFATVDEAREGFKRILVSAAPFTQYGNAPALMRLDLHDRSGKSIVIEYIGGELVITDNPTGAMTNDPPFRDQLATLGNYGFLTTSERAPTTIGGAQFSAVSSGSGSAGLPGSYLSTDRFVRAVFLSSSIPQNYTTAQKVNAVWHTMGSFDITPGVLRLPAGSSYGGGAAGNEIAQWIVVADSKNLVYQFRMFDNMDIQEFSFKNFDPELRQIKYIAPAKKQRVVELR